MVDYCIGLMYCALVELKIIHRSYINNVDIVTATGDGPALNKKVLMCLMMFQPGK